VSGFNSGEAKEISVREERVLALIPGEKEIRRFQRRPGQEQAGRLRADEYLLLQELTSESNGALPVVYTQWVNMYIYIQYIYRQTERE